MLVTGTQEMQELIDDDPQGFIKRIHATNEETIKNMTVLGVDDPVKRPSL